MMMMNIIGMVENDQVMQCDGINRDKVTGVGDLKTFAVHVDEIQTSVINV